MIVYQVSRRSARVSGNPSLIALVVSIDVHLVWDVFLLWNAVAHRKTKGTRQRMDLVPVERKVQWHEALTTWGPSFLKASFHLNSRCHRTVMSSTCSAAEVFSWIRDSLATKRRPTKRVTFRWTLTVALGLQMVLIPGSMEHASLHIKGHQIYQKHKAKVIFLTDRIRNFSLEFFRPFKLKYSNHVLQWREFLVIETCAKGRGGGWYMVF